MRLNLYACLAVVGALMSVTSAVADPEFDPFLSVDVNGWVNDFSGAVFPGPTQAGYQAWDVDGSAVSPWSLSTDAAGITMAFGGVTAEMIGHTPPCIAGTNCQNPAMGSRSARDRGTPGGTNAELRQDWTFLSRAHDGFGQEWIELQLSGLEPGKEYEFTGFHADHFNGEEESFQSWTDLARLGGSDGPGGWLNDNVGAGAVYQPAIGGVNNPIPTAGRGLSTGPEPGVGEEYKYSVSFRTFADANGIVTVYTWADPNSYSGTQTATLFAGFQLGLAPEPTSFVVFVIGLCGIAGFRFRVR
jgi:hypothetical protein